MGKLAGGGSGIRTLSTVRREKHRFWSEGFEYLRRATGWTFEPKAGQGLDATKIDKDSSV
jgi:hypothetical protein